MTSDEVLSAAMYCALNTVYWLALCQAVMMTILIFLSAAHRTDNDPPEGVRIHIHILISVAQPGCDVTNKLNVPLSLKPACALS